MSTSIKRIWSTIVIRIFGLRSSFSAQGQNQVSKRTINTNTGTGTRAFRFAIRIDSPIHFKRIDSNRFVFLNRPFDSLVVLQFFLLIIAVSTKSHRQHFGNKHNKHIGR